MELLSVVRNTFPEPVDGPRSIYNLTGSSAALFLALKRKPFVAIEKDEAHAETLAKDIAFFRMIFSGPKVLFLPDPDGAEAAGVRSEILLKLQSSDSLVTSSNNLFSNLWDREQVSALSLEIRKGGLKSRALFEEDLIMLGYHKVPMVVERGEYSQRGWIIDVFPSTSGDPLRVEFFGDEIEQVRTFDVETQKSREEKDEFLLLPAIELDERRSLSELVSEKVFYCLDSVQEKNGLPGDTVFLSRYSFKTGTAADGQEREKEEIPQTEAGMLSFSGCGVLPEERKGIGDLPEVLKILAQKHRIILVASSSGQAERLRDVFRERDVIAPFVDINELHDYAGTISITIGGLSAGLFFEGLLVLTEKELFGERPAFRPIKKSKLTNLLVYLDDITPGDYVVHREHGIGRFSGVVKQQGDDTELELMQIEYEGGRIYIPIQNIQNIAKYRSEEGVVPRVDRLGGKTWQKKKERARKRVQELAEKLLTLYAGRQVARGFTFSPDSEMHREFDGFFAYDATQDQLKAGDEIKKDMESESPMDRLLCGDVGYGKTEVAMRAAFKAVYDNRQVAVLVPTTILAEQHYRTFRERFSGFPVAVDYISRFKSPKEISLALKGIAGGETDILIGTHALLSKKISFSRLGLLIVDEEHRFGVGQKEKIKELSRNIDVLNLTATPIPRTLHMALSGIRNISVIETPPEERLSVKSMVSVFSDDLIRQAVNAELRRDGQVFFVHNRIQDIYRIAGHVQEIVPSAKLGVAHGRMPEKELERVMHRFFEAEINVLVSTAIIGSGLDIPRANTIIINMAERMGLADLYQLRGRVGRSRLKGYAYFLAPPESALTEEAKKRLQAVQEMSYLGAGFRLALKDLEIRGAGDIFGAEQSGHIHEIGFDLYIEMLENAVAELKGIEVKEEIEPVIDLRASAFIPEDYIGDISLRLSIYRRVASLKTEEEVLEIESELRDRFGALTDEVNSLLRVMKLKILAKRLLIAKIQQHKEKAVVLFSADTPVQPAHVFSLQHSRKGKIRFLPQGFELDIRGAGNEKVYEELRKALEELSSCAGSLPPS